MTRVLTVQAIEGLLPLLPADERLVLGLRLGVAGARPRAVIDIASFSGLSTHQVRALENRAMSRLQHPSMQSVVAAA